VALGAPRGRIVAEFLGTALRVIGIACVAGLVLSLTLSPLLASWLYGVSSREPLTLAAVVALVGAVGVAAALVPALRAARVDPMTVLREE
jgi:ABC-type antimicrobial peptide transport system permease subunit